MRNKLAIKGLAGCLILLAALLSTLAAGKMIYGKVTEVRSAEVVVLNYGTGQYTVHIVGIDTPSQGRIADETRQFVSNLVLGKNVSMLFESRAPNGEMVSRIYAGEAFARIPRYRITICSEQR